MVELKSDWNDIFPLQKDLRALYLTDKELLIGDKKSTRHISFKDIKDIRYTRSVMTYPLIAPVHVLYNGKEYRFISASSFPLGDLFGFGFEKIRKTEGLYKKLQKAVSSSQ